MYIDAIFINMNVQKDRNDVQKRFNIVRDEQNDKIDELANEKFEFPQK